MSSTAVAASAGGLRPGLVAGRYPERQEQPADIVERAWFATKDRWSTTFSRSAKRSLTMIAQRVNEAGRGLKSLSDGELRETVRITQRKLRREGLKDEHCIQAFALVREAADRTLGKRHYDVQVMGAWTMLQGQLAEMQTGEGKTLTAALAAATAALAGIPVHVLTVNDYLVERDAELLKPLYNALGLMVGTVTPTMSPEARMAGYACDITYGTNKQMAFDYLRDRLQRGPEGNELQWQLESAYRSDHRAGKLLLRGLCFAIVDEADSVLIDEARTPLILTRLVDATEEHVLYQQALLCAEGLSDPADYQYPRGSQSIALTQAGQAKVAASPLGDALTDSHYADELVQQALKALYQLKKDRDYLVQDGEIQIVDANTGRVLPDRAWERGLHQMIEIKEGCEPTQKREVLARLTYQRFFRRYLRLGGMTGTAHEVRNELRSVYSLRVRTIPLNRPCRRTSMPQQIVPTIDEKWAKVVAATQQMFSEGRPVLVGTASVEESERLSERLTAAGLPHSVLNARQDQHEAAIVARAGQKKQITVATNMAGRGTDIALGPGVAEQGGLHVIATSANEAARVDRQLIGRCARQGDPGSYQQIYSLDDELLQKGASGLLLQRVQRWSARNYPGHKRLAVRITDRAQRKIESVHAMARKQLLQQEQQLGKSLAFAGRME